MQHLSSLHMPAVAVRCMDVAGIFRLNDFDLGEGTVPLATYTDLPQFIYGVEHQSRSMKLRTLELCLWKSHSEILLSIRAQPEPWGCITCPGPPSGTASPQPRAPEKQRCCSE